MELLPADTSPDVHERSADVAVLPIGSLEQHGPHLPLTTDTVVAATVAARIADAHPVRLLPPVTFSCSHEHAAWPGTVSLSATTLVAIVRDVADSLRRDGVRTLVLVNGHGGNYVLGNVVQEASLGPLPMALFPQVHDWAAARVAAGLVTSDEADMHAGELETSVLLHFHPHLVRPHYARADHDAEHRPHLLSRGLQEYSESGVVGRPSLASAEKGRAVVASLVSSFAAYR
ncbi:creatininase family protein [Pseudonocardia endophytica]|uniref:creatininase family protein n=1 Tax=Pseudonocardia endophytica TaxID=401976 RepID=UPI0010443478|nr:creatininase family protein [Pseudonocardia endophytica]